MKMILFSVAGIQPTPISQPVVSLMPLGSGCLMPKALGGGGGWWEN